MRCSICLEEMDHPEKSVFSCPRKGETWHNQEYKLALRRLHELDYQLRGTQTDRQGILEAAEHLLELRGELRICEYPDCYQVFKPSTYGKDYYCVDHVERGLAS